MAHTARWRRIVGKTVLSVFGALAALVVVVVLAANLPFSRRLIAKEVTAALAKVVTGTITIEHVGRIGLTGVGDVSARLTDARGRPVLTASGVKASIRTFTLLRSLLGKSGLDVHIDSVRIGHVDVLLDADQNGNLLLLSALTPSPPPATAQPAQPSSPSSLRLTIDDARIASTWAHGTPTPGFPVDANLRDLRVDVGLASGRTTVDLRALHVDTRVMPAGANVHADVHGHVELPPAPKKLASQATS